MSERHHAQSLEALLLHEANSATWLVLEREARTLQRIYEIEESPDLHYLFHDTRYAEMGDKSPLVVRSSPETPLWQAFVEGGAEPLKGIVVTSRTPTDVVMAHLRRLLEVSFYGRRRALLRFYDPWIMASLLGADTSVTRWLGPLAAIYWYGGTFDQRAEQGPAWHACLKRQEKGATQDVITSEEIVLTREEEAALERFVADYPLWADLEARAGLDTGSAEHTARFIALLEEAEELSIPAAKWRDYLGLRFVHYRAGLPGDITAYPAAERVTALHHHIHHHFDDTSTRKVWA